MVAYSSVAHPRTDASAAREDENATGPSRRGRPVEWLVFVAVLFSALWMFAAWVRSDGVNTVNSVDDTNSPALIR
ncbi:MAG: hypothetical protein ABIV50_04650 [Opitutus sp.]